MNCSHRTEFGVQIMTFTDKLKDFPIRKDEPLQEIIKRTSNLPFGNTDCSLPITHAIKKKLDVDVFVVLTDSETCRIYLSHVLISQLPSKLRQRVKPEGRALRPPNFVMLDLLRMFHSNGALLLCLLSPRTLLCLKVKQADGLQLHLMY